MIIRALLFCIMCLLPTCGVKSEVVKGMFMYDHLGTIEGLQSMRVFSIIEDTDNAMWFGTKNGVARYNGSKLKNYLLTTQNIYSDASGRIVKLFRQPDGDIIAFDNKGKIFRYIPYSDTFVPYAQHFTTAFVELNNAINGWIILNDLITDADGNYWAATSHGLCIMSADNKMQLLYRGHYANSLIVSGHNIIMCTNKGAVFVDMKTKKTVRHIPGYNVQTAFYDKLTGYLWLGTFNRGVSVVNMKTGREVGGTELDMFPHMPVRDIKMLNDSLLIFGVDGGGIFAATRRGRNGRLLFSADEQTGDVLHGNGIYAICRDSQGNIWMGSYTGGVDVAYPTGSIFEILQHKNLNSQSLVNNVVHDILETSGSILFATDGGVSIMDKRTGHWTHTLANKVVLTLCNGKDGKIYAGTYGNGVYEVTPGGDNRPIYSVANGKLSTNYVCCIYCDKDGDLWIGCLDGKLIQMGNDGSIRKHDILTTQCITSMPDGRIAVGTTNGFYVIDKHSGRTKHYFHIGDYDGRDVNFYIQSILFDSNNKVWLATEGGGIYLYDMRAKSMSNITTRRGLPSNNVYALGRDAHGRIIASTDHGMALVYPNKKNAVGINFINGLTREYNRMSMEQLADGRFVFGSNSGAVIINPLIIRKLQYNARLNLTGISIGGGTDISDEERAEIYDMFRQGRLELTHSQNTFEINYECIYYKYRNDILYQYMLEGFNDTWSEASAMQTAAYTNLPAGKYRLLVRSISRNDGRIIDSRQLDICVAQPWWNSVPAWIVYILLMLTLAFFLWKYYRNRLERKYFNEKINFFTNTAHEIRTPLSLILAPLSNIATDKSLSSESRHYLDIARNNGGKLMSVITDLLDFQKTDSIGTRMNICQLDLQNLLETEAEKFRLLASRKDITITIAECPQTHIWMDRYMADKIFENLLSNAIKYTGNGGKVTLRAWTDGKNIYIKVEDNGIGIPKNEQKHIFRSFYRAENAISTNETGSGIGLILVRRLVNMHKGKLSFESEEGRGTAFTIALKAGYAHLVHYIEQEPCTDEEAAAEMPEQSPAAVNISAPSADESAPHTEGKKDIVLFVDDNEELRNYIALAFSDRYTIVTRENAAEAMEYLNGGECDIVVSDVMMPGMQGDELCHRIKENPETSWLPVILLTAKAGRDFIIKGLETGADDYITKPFDTAILQSKIDNILANRRRLSKYYLSRMSAIAASEPSDAGSVAEAEEPAPGEMNPADKLFIDKATMLVIENISDTDFNIDRLCAEMAMSRTLFYGRLKTLTAQTPQDFIRTIRLERAAALLKDGKPILDVSVMTGFTNSKHFSTVFKKHFGVSPSKYV